MLQGAATGINGGLEYPRAVGESREAFLWLLRTRERLARAVEPSDGRMDFMQHQLLPRQSVEESERFIETSASVVEAKEASNRVNRASSRLQ